MEEQASDKQIDFMKTLKCSYPDRVTKQQAKEIIKDALERQNGVAVEKHEDFKMYGSKKPTNGNGKSYPKDPVGLAVELMIEGFPKEDISSAQSKDLMATCINLVKQAQKEFS